MNCSVRLATIYGMNRHDPHEFGLIELHRDPVQGSRPGGMTTGMIASAGKLGARPAAATAAGWPETHRAIILADGVRLVIR